MSTTTHASADASSVPATKPAPTTTISLPPYSFDTSVPPPKLIQTGTDYKAILQSLLDYANWTVAHRPDPALSANFTIPGSALDGSYRRNLAILKRNVKRGYEIRTGENAIKIVSVKPDLFTARVDEQVARQRIVDRRGVITSELKAVSPTTIYSYVVAKSNGRWYLVDSSDKPAERSQ